jgi:hypothetical protein
LRKTLLTILRILRRSATLFWLLMLVYLMVGIGWWLATYNPPLGIVDVGGVAALLLFLALGLFLLTYKLDRADMAAKLKASRFTGVMITLTTLCVILLVLEIGMRAFMYGSDDFARTLPHQRWQQLYWTPVNSLGYRDIEPEVESSKTQILVLGDSFAAGHGIEGIEDTFPHVLNALLGENYRVHVAAIPGWSTDDQFAALSRFPIKPEIVVLSYFVNDIEFSATQHGLFPQWPPSTDGTSLGWLVDHFYLANYLYWRVYVYRLSGFPQRYSDYILSAYDNAAVWTMLLAELDKMVTWTQANNARLVVLLWPVLTNLDWSAQVLAPVQAHLAGQGVTVVNMADALAGKSASELVVNALDAHPNMVVHRLAAEKLYAALQEID